MPESAAAPASSPSDRDRRFAGVGRLVGRAGLERLGGARVCVIGLGGVGSWTVEALARSGVGALTLVDFDAVCASNVNRQLPALTDTIGRPKAVVLAERVAAINPACRVQAVTELFCQDNHARILAPAFDCVVDAMDSLQHKLLAIWRCRERGLRIVTVGGSAGKRDGTRVRVADLGESETDALLRFVRKRLRERHGFPGGEGSRFGVRCVYSPEHPVHPWSDGSVRSTAEPGCEEEHEGRHGLGTAAFVTGAFGLAAAGEAVRLICAER